MILLKHIKVQVRIKNIENDKLKETRGEEFFKKMLWLNNGQ